MNPPQHPNRTPGPPIDEALVINTRLNELERHKELEKAEERNYKNAQLRLTYWTVGLTGLLVLTSCASGWFMYIQTEAARTSAEAARMAAKAAIDSLDYAKTSGAETSAENRRALDATLKQAALALHVGERARIYVSLLGPIDLAIGKQIMAPVDMLNYGRTPARDVHLEMASILLKRGAQPEFNFKDYAVLDVGIFPPKDLIPPPPIPRAFPVLQRVSAVPKKNAPVILTRELRAELDSGSVWLLNYAKVTYKDMFGVNHFATACIVAPTATLLPGDRGWVKACGAYNADDGKP